MEKKNKDKTEIEVFVEKDNSKRKTKVVFGKSTIKDVLDALKIRSSESIITLNDEVVLEDEVINSGDKVKILSVISGG
jgi:sulfur carrier protein